MLKRKTDNLVPMIRAYYANISDFVRTGLIGRSRQVLAITTLAAVAFLSLMAAAVTNTPDPATSPEALAAAATERADAGDRADRSARESASPSAKPAKKAAPKPTKKAAPKPAPAWVSPMPGAELTSCYGQRWGVLHAGIDFAKPAGTKILSVGAGKIVAAGWTYSGYGDSVVVDHGNGYLTHYAHMSKDTVSVGQKVKAGQVLGYEGSTGDSTGPHLHFEVHKGSMFKQIEPASWLRAKGVKLGC